MLCLLQSVLSGQYIGQLQLPVSLPPSPGAQNTEACFELVDNPSGKEVISYLGVVRFTRLDPPQPVSVASLAADLPGPLPTGMPPPKRLQTPLTVNLPVLKPSKPGAAPVAVPAPGLNMSSGEMRWLVGPQPEKAPAPANRGKHDIKAASTGTGAVSMKASKTAKFPTPVGRPRLGPAAVPAFTAAPAMAAATGRSVSGVADDISDKRLPQHLNKLHAKLNATEEMIQVELDAYTVAAAKRQSTNGKDDASRWQQLRLEHLWPDGQHRLESMFSPYQSEGIETCDRCQPAL